MFNTPTKIFHVCRDAEAGLLDVLGEIWVGLYSILTFGMRVTNRPLPERHTEDSRAAKSCVFLRKPRDEEKLHKLLPKTILLKNADNHWHKWVHGYLKIDVLPLC